MSESAESDPTGYRLSTVLRIAFANSVGFSAATAVPMWVSVVGAHVGMAAWAGGAIATGQLACAALVNATTPWLFGRTALKRLALVGTALGLGGNLLALVPASAAFILGCLICGAGFGALLNSTNRCIANSSAPQKAYSVVWLVEVLFNIFFLLIAPPLIQRFGMVSVFVLLCLLCVLALAVLATLSIPVPAQLPGALQRRAVFNPIAAGLALLGLTFVFIGQNTIISFLVPMGAAVGLNVLWVGRVMAIGLVASLFGALIARALGERIGILAPLLGGTAALAIDFVIVTSGGNPATFVTATIVIFVCIMFVVPYAFALLAGLDRTGRLASMGPAFILVGVSLGPSIGAYFGQGGNFRVLGYIGFSCLAMAAAFFNWAHRLPLTVAPARG